MNVDFPFHFDAQHRTATDDDHDHIRDMIEQLLFTIPGERVNRPDFGCGIGQFVFEPNSSPIAAALELSIRSNLERWLGDLITVERLDVTSDDATLNVTIGYLLVADNRRSTTTFTAPGTP